MDGTDMAKQLTQASKEQAISKLEQIDPLLKDLCKDQMQVTMMVDEFLSEGMHQIPPWTDQYPGGKMMRRAGKLSHQAATEFGRARAACIDASDPQAALERAVKLFTSASQHAKMAEHLIRDAKANPLEGVF